jgi:hypothetical protein
MMDLVKMELGTQTMQKGKRIKGLEIPFQIPRHQAKGEKERASIMTNKLS